MITTTTYTQRVTITTDDDGSRTVTRSSHADTATAYLFSELSPEAQEAAIAEAIAEEQDERNWYSSMTYLREEEIWQAAQDLAKRQPVRFYSDAGGSPAAEARSGRWGYDPCELVTMGTDDGTDWSMDICDAWNAYAPRIMALMEAVDEAAEARDDAEQRAEEAAQAGEDASADRAALDLYDSISDRCWTAAEELTEEAARRCGDVVDGLIEGVRDWYASPEFWREWLDDGESRFTREGHRI